MPWIMTTGTPAPGSAPPSSTATCKRGGRRRNPLNRPMLSRLVRPRAPAPSVLTQLLLVLVLVLDGVAMRFGLLHLGVGLHFVDLVRDPLLGIVECLADLLAGGV